MTISLIGLSVAGMVAAGALALGVANAGIVRLRMAYNMTEADWDETIAVHLKGLFTVVKPASVVFRQQRSGRFVTTSVVGIQPFSRRR